MIKVRVTYSKLGRFVLMGHLDTMMHIDMALRRTGLDFVTGQGYKRKIKFSSSPALSLGVESLCEYIDVKIIDDYPGDIIFRRFADNFPPGLEIIKTEIIRGKALQPKAAVYEKKEKFLGLFSRIARKTIVFGSGEKISFPAVRVSFIFE
ncbi:MAG: TIGR03936 family radical SAM-associated protein [Elusimicrobiota bacterium]|nr:TIGR03936 family radical SAM-associated protein [Elusimicrobiota bacterium]